MSYDDAHARNLAEAVAAFTDPKAAVHVRTRCGWCEGTGEVPRWDGWARAVDVTCARCAGRGFVLVEAESCND